MGLFVCTPLILTVISSISAIVSGSVTCVGALTVMEKERLTRVGGARPGGASSTVTVILKFPLAVGVP